VRGRGCPRALVCPAQLRPIGPDRRRAETPAALAPSRYRGHRVKANYTNDRCRFYAAYPKLSGPLLLAVSTRKLRFCPLCQRDLAENVTGIQQEGARSHILIALAILIRFMLVLYLSLTKLCNSCASNMATARGMGTGQRSRLGIRQSPPSSRDAPPSTCLARHDAGTRVVSVRPRRGTRRA
jgi:hypothetical protein